MKCQYCHDNEAVNTFLVTYPGGSGEVHLCEDCTRKAHHYYALAHGEKQSTAIGPAHKGAQRKVGNIPFPVAAPNSICQRRQLNVLNARLAEAVEKEHYEEAARLRDEILAAQHATHPQKC